ncbi:hypothetical protein DMUE_2942 [Dictyocoela muelleri]|nr:hypothetical protein DMUE_2942 [Dictyocoela muelleri]
MYFECRGGIQRAYACIKSDKKMETIVPIINNVVTPGSIIWTDEHRSYSRLSDNFEHSTVCHNYEFVNYNTGTNTQAIESFNNCLKYEIKNQKSVLTVKRASFLKIYLFFYNNKNNLFGMGLKLLKIN